MKKTVRKKKAIRKTNINGTGGGKANDTAELNELEKEVLQIMNPKSVHGMDIPETQVAFVS